MKILVISGSSRKESNSLKVATAIAGILKEKGHEPGFIDMRESDIPFIGPVQFEFTDELSEFQKKCVDLVSQAELIFLVAPEYNWGTSATVKNFIDQFGVKKFAPMWDKKVYALAGVSDGSGGKMPVIQLMVSINKLFAIMGGVGVVSPKTFISQTTQNMLNPDGTFKDQPYKEAMDRFIDYSIKVSEIFQKGLN